MNNMVKYRISAIELSGAYIGRKNKVDIIDADHIMTTQCGVTLYINNEIVYFAPSFLCVEKITDEDANKDILKKGGWNQ
jgi:hypothetical protein